MTPYLEQTSVFNSVNFSFPLYGEAVPVLSSQVYPANTTTVNVMVLEFLCPSDRMERLTTADGFLGGAGRQFAPTNYQFCAGSGASGGDVRGDVDDSWVRISDNGRGMKPADIREALRFGTVRDYDERKALVGTP